MFIKLIIALIVVSIHLCLIMDLRSSGKEVESRLQLQTFHDKAKETIAANLVGECSFFKSDLPKRKVSSYLSHNDLSFNIGKKQIISINDLLFEEIIFRVFKSKQPNVYYESIGYMVTSNSSLKCFGIL